jgi:UPF0716 protein FxsA
MGWILLLLFIGVPLVEIALFIEIGGQIGVLSTVAVVVFTALLGSYLLRAQGLATFHRARTDMQSGSLPATQVVHGLFLVIAGALLLTPGFLTDGIGFLLFVPSIRLALGRKVLAYITAHGEVYVAGDFGGTPGPSGPGGPRPSKGGSNGPVIDGEVFEEDD